MLHKILLAIIACDFVVITVKNPDKLYGDVDYASEYNNCNSRTTYSECLVN
jgi:hypothetical protein